MAEKTNIEWADATFNPWRGCTEVSPACDHCYARELAERWGWAKWGDHPRERAAASTWKQPLVWNRQADAFEAEHGRPRMVFCASLADVFDNQVPEEWRHDLWGLIHRTPRLIWLLLTKRPQNIRKMLPPEWGEGWPNVWLGTTVENQAVADRNIPVLLRVPAAKRFLSCEPLLGRITLFEVGSASMSYNAFTGDVTYRRPDGMGSMKQSIFGGIDWVIAGGESGPNARFPDVRWFRLLRDHCAAAGVPFMFKQWGEFGQVSGKPGGEQWGVRRLGKKKAGRLLDGVLHDGRPEIR